MVKQVPYFEDSTGKPHKTMHEAWKADIAIWLAGTAVINPAQATQLVEYLTTGGRTRVDEFASMLNEFALTMPEPTVAVRGPVPNSVNLSHVDGTDA